MKQIINEKNNQLFYNNLIIFNRICIEYVGSKFVISGKIILKNKN